MMEPKTLVVTDDREYLRGRRAALARQADCEVVIRRLPLGDYRIAGRLLVEQGVLAGSRRFHR
jgi:ERCC4-type nuclease